MQDENMKIQKKVTAKFIEESWPLTKVKVSHIKGNTGGGYVGIVESSEGKYIYKIPGPWKTPKNVARDLTGIDYLNIICFKHTSRLLKTQEGENSIVIESRPIFLLEYIEGETPTSSPETYRELGRITALLHQVPNFPFETDFDASIIIEDLKKSAKNFEFEKEYSEVLSDLPDFSDLPDTLIHTDIAPCNSIKSADGTLILIDWDEIGIGKTVLDVGGPLVSQFVSEDLEFDEDSTNSFYKAYFKQRKLSDDEMNHIFDAALFWACMDIVHGNTPKRWKRISWAMENRKMLEKVVKDQSL
jgi:Ser/Thr protein kinase RdoA (MazF antagonist)